MTEEQSNTGQPARRERRDVVEHRRQVLSAAKQLFAEQGAENTTMHEIAQLAGVGQGTLYRRFAHKGELCHALIAEDVEAFQMHVERLISGPDAPVLPLSRLDALLTALILLTEQHLPLFAVIERSSAGQRRGKPFRSPFHGWLREQIAGLLAQAVDLGEVAPLDAEYTADAILAVLAPPVLSHQRSDRGYSVDRITAGVRRLFVEKQLHLPG
jgi:AcrR family transcriptional regulator